MFICLSNKPNAAIREDDLLKRGGITKVKSILICFHKYQNPTWLQADIYILNHF